MIRMPRWIAGDRPALGRLGGRAAEVRSGSQKADPRSGLSLARASWGTAIRRALGLPIYGRLSGAGPAYSFARAVELGGTWGAGPGSGTAYEVNGVTGLAGTRQLLRPDRSGAWRFQAIRPGRTPPCSSATACITFEPACPEAPSGVSASMTFTPTDPGGTSVTVTGSSLSLCLTHVGAGTVAWTFSADNYLARSGSFAVTECGTGGGPVVDVYPNSYRVCLFGCNIVTDGTAVTITASGSFSGTCTPTASTIPAGRPFAGTPALCCTFAVTEPITTPPTIAVEADRYQVDHGTATIVGTCWATVHMEAADGYFCCDPTGTGTCKPIKNTGTLSTPLGDIAIDFGATGTHYSITANVTGIPETVGPYGVIGGCAAVPRPAAATVPVTFYLTSFGCSSSGFVGTFLYSACIDPSESGPTNCLDAIAVQDPGLDAQVAGTFTFHLTGHCPPGLVGDGGTQCGPNRYLSGTYTLTEA